MSDTPQTYSILLHSGDFARLHYGLLMARAALGRAAAVTVMFAGESVHMLNARFVLPDENYRIKAMRVDGVNELLAELTEAGAKLLVCEDSLVLQEMAEKALREDLPLEVAAPCAFLESCGEEGVQLVF
jgi:predicted peroxiredoxin